jgi:AraC-like DNA-binding protein
MNSRLNQITNWAERVKMANYNAKALAVICGSCERQLRRFIREVKGKSTQKWLNELRLTDLFPRLKAGEPVKQVAYSLGFKHASQLSRDFKNFYGQAPSRVRESSPCLSSLGSPESPPVLCQSPSQSCVSASQGLLDLR